MYLVNGFLRRRFSFLPRVSAGSRITRTVSAGSQFSCTVVSAGNRSRTVSAEAIYDGSLCRKRKLADSFIPCEEELIDWLAPAELAVSAGGCFWIVALISSVFRSLWHSWLIWTKKSKRAMMHWIAHLSNQANGQTHHLNKPDYLKLSNYDRH